jgi:hypothetical protein
MVDDAENTWYPPTPYVLAPQLVQLVDPVVVVYVPAGQTVHDALRAVPEYVPTGHGTQVVPET